MKRKFCYVVLILEKIRKQSKESFKNSQNQSRFQKEETSYAIFRFYAKIRLIFNILTCFSRTLCPYYYDRQIVRSIADATSKTFEILT